MISGIQHVPIVSEDPTKARTTRFSIPQSKSLHGPRCTRPTSLSVARAAAVATCQTSLARTSGRCWIGLRVPVAWDDFDLPAFDACAPNAVTVVPNLLPQKLLGVAQLGKFASFRIVREFVLELAAQLANTVVHVSRAAVRSCYRRAGILGGPVNEDRQRLQYGQRFAGGVCQTDISWPWASTLRSTGHIHWMESIDLHLRCGQQGSRLSNRLNALGIESGMAKRPCRHCGRGRPCCVLEAVRPPTACADSPSCGANVRFFNAPAASPSRGIVARTALVDPAWRRES